MKKKNKIKYINLMICLKSNKKIIILIQISQKILEIIINCIKTYIVLKINSLLLILNYIKIIRM